MDVVDEQIIDLAEGLAEFVHGLGAEGIEERVEEVFAGGVADARLRIVGLHLVRHGEQQMRLAHAGPAVDVQGVDRAGFLRGGERGGIRVAVFLADHEIVERVLADQVRQFGGNRLGVGLRVLAGIPVELGIFQSGVLGIVAVTVLEHHFQPRISRGSEGFVEKVAAIIQHPGGEKAVGRAEHDLLLIDRNRDHLLEPLFVRVFGLGSDISCDGLPYFGGTAFSVRHFLPLVVLTVSFKIVFPQLVDNPRNGPCGGPPGGNSGPNDKAPQITGAKGFPRENRGSCFRFVLSLRAVSFRRFGIHA